MFENQRSGGQHSLPPPPVSEPLKQERSASPAAVRLPPFQPPSIRRSDVPDLKAAAEEEAGGISGLLGNLKLPSFEIPKLGLPSLSLPSFLGGETSDAEEAAKAQQKKEDVRDILPPLPKTEKRPPEFAQNNKSPDIAQVSISSYAFVHCHAHSQHFSQFKLLMCS